MFNFNVEIEEALTALGTPYAYMQYEGSADTYITYMQTDKSNTLAGDDQVLGCVVYYDFDIYSRENYLGLIDALIDKLEGYGWTYEPSRDSPDLYETDTRYYHKTICMAKESQRESEE